MVIDLADKRYSIDDILNEYNKNGHTGSLPENNADGFILDDILQDFKGKASSGSPADALSGQLDDIKISLQNTDLLPKADLLGNKEYSVNKQDSKKRIEQQKPEADNISVKLENKQDKFEQKYKSLSSASAKAKEYPADRMGDSISVKQKIKSERSFSDKFEIDNVYEDKESSGDAIKKAGLFTGKKEKTISGDNKPHEINSPDNKKNDPFDKYSSVAEKSLDDILEEYSVNKEKKYKNQNTHHKSLTDFFTRLIPKSETGENEALGNTELIDSMIRMKKERQSRTSYVSPIERKSISDIDLHLDDKIIPNTAQIPITPEHNEIEKATALKERRNKKIKDFVLIGDEEESFEDEPAEYDGQPKIIEDFDSFEDASSIANDIDQLKSSLAMRLFVLVICFAVSIYIAIANDTQALPIMELLNKRTQTNVFLFVNTVIGLLAAFSSYTVISCGLSKLISMKADCDSLSAVSTISSITLSMIMFANTNLIKGSLVHNYIPIAIASLLFNTAGKLLIVSRTQRSFTFVSGAGEKYAIFAVTDEEQAQNFTRGALRDFPSLASMKKTEFLAEFLKTSYSSDATDRFCRVFSPIVTVISLVIAAVAGVLGNIEFSGSGIYIGLSVFTACISICAGFSIMLVVNLPVSRASRKYAELQGVILGNDCIDEFADTNSILIDAKELFPHGSVSLSAIKVFSDTRIDEAIVEAASLTNHAGSILQNMFYDIIAGKTELLNPVESYIYEDSMGLCGWINNKRVLLGNRELMINHSIEGIPTEAKEKEYSENGRAAVYLSISGELSAMFIIDLLPSLEVKNALRNLQKNDIYIIIRSVDSIVTINRLSDMFDISPEIFKLIPFRLHQSFEDIVSYQPRQKATLACSGRFSVLSSLILSCKRIRGTISAGIGLQAVSMLLGILICLVMVIFKSFSELSVSMIASFCAFFTLALIALQSVRKS